MYHNFKKASPNDMHQYVEKHFSEKEICNRFTELYHLAKQTNRTH